MAGTINITTPSGGPGGIPVVDRRVNLQGTFSFAGFPAGNLTNKLILLTAGGAAQGFVVPPSSGSVWNGSVSAPASARGSDTFSITATLQADLVDGEGRHEKITGMSKSITVRLQDLVGPAIAINGGPNLPDITVAAGQTTASLTLGGTANDPDSRVASVAVRLDLNAFENVFVNDVNGNATWNRSYSLTAGLHRFNAFATDNGGHASGMAEAFVMAKPTPPWVDPLNASITSWTRLEPQCRTAEVGQTIAARIFDPLWMMARQWQVGEFQGIDGGTPVQARLRATSATLSRLRVGATGAGVPYDPSRAPLEALVERRPMRPAVPVDPNMLRLGVEGGLYFLRMLDQQTLTKYRAAFIARFVLAQLDREVEPGVDDATRRYVQLMIGRAPNAWPLATALRAAGGAAAVTADPTLKVVAADSTKVQQLLTTWLAWFDALFAQPASVADDAWDPNRMEYAVTVGAALSAQTADQVTLSANELDDGRFAWSSFDTDAAAPLGTAGDGKFTSIVETTIPTPVTFRGAPAVRFWEMEDARVSYGLAPVGKTDIAHLMAIEYASAYGNDWFTVPLTVPVGSLTRIDSLVVTDSFGVRTLVRPMGAPGMPTPYFSMWQHSTRRTGGSPLDAAVTRNLFFLPPSIGRVVESAPLEDVMLLRDEQANIAWAVERAIESPLEQSQSTAYDPQAPTAVTAATPGVPRYLLSTTVPGNWIPLLPVQQRVGSGPTTLRLRVGAVLEPNGSNIKHPARSELLRAAPQLQLYDADVPREGVRVVRSRRLARWTDGSTWVWSAFRKSVGRGEGSSGLRFDSLNE